MTELDKALDAMRRDMGDAANQSKFYDLFLKSTFFVPTLDEQLPGGGTDPVPEGEVLPLVIEAEGNDYLMLFDSKERMDTWAESQVESVQVPGHVLAATTMPPLHWALNVGTEHVKQFTPEEITWLRDVVARCNADAAEGSEEG